MQPREFESPTLRTFYPLNALFEVIDNLLLHAKIRLLLRRAWCTF